MSEVIEVIGIEEAKEVVKEAGVAGRKAITRSINRTTQRTRKQVSIKAREKTTVKASYAKGNITIPQRATANSLGAKVVISGKRIPLIGYSVRQNKKGVSGRIFKSDPIIHRPHAFIATMKSGHKGVFWRKRRRGGPGRQGNAWQDDMQAFYKMLHSVKSKYRNWDKELVVRLGITELAGPALPDLIKNDIVWDALAADANRYLFKELDTNLAYYLGKI